MVATQIKLEKIELSKVRSAYSGKPGCMCGCNGKYSYASQYRDESSKSRGYTVDDDEVSDRGVKILVNKMNRWIEIGEYEDASCDSTYSYLEHDGRSYAVYFA